MYWFRDLYPNPPGPGARDKREGQQYKETNDKEEVLDNRSEVNVIEGEGECVYRLM